MSFIASSSRVGLHQCRLYPAGLTSFHNTTASLGGGPRTQPKFKKNGKPLSSLCSSKTTPSTEQVAESSSRTRLVKDLDPKSNRGSPGTLEVAGPSKVRNRAERIAKRDGAAARRATEVESAFIRDSVPHSADRDRWKQTNEGGRRSSHVFDHSPTKRTKSLNSVHSQRNSIDRGNAATRRNHPGPSSAVSPGRQSKSKMSHIPDAISPEFVPPSPADLPQEFSSPPLLPGLADSIADVIGPTARPTPIQALSLKHLLMGDDGKRSTSWRQFLLASETGSGKSIAYLLPMLQALKISELNPPAPLLHHTQPRHRRLLNPRGLILAPTHELSRQLAGFAKDLLHNVKLRVQCASRANMTNDDRAATSSKMAERFDQELEKDGAGTEFAVQGPRSGKGADVDIVVGTPNRILEMVRGWRWADSESREERLRKNEPEMGLAGIEWVVVDEADVLFDPDFIDTTTLILADISSSRGHPIPSIPSPFDPPSDRPIPLHQRHSEPGSQTNSASSPPPHKYPFNLVLTSATIPSSLASYLDTNHPTLTRLASPGLHKLPRGLETEYVNWSGGSRWADVEMRVRKVWAEDAAISGRSTAEGSSKSKVLIFCNKGTTVEALGKYLEDKGVPNIALTSKGVARKSGSNHHLDGFLRSKKDKKKTTNSTTPTLTRSPKPKAPNSDQPHVLITTSLLSRGLDFAPSIRHVLIPEPPRNMVDFLHRAGRSGRAGEWGRVVVFVKMKGRGSLVGRQVRKNVGELKSRDSSGLVLDEQWDGGLEQDWGLEGGGSQRGKEFAMGRDGTKVREESLAKETTADALKLGGASP